MSSLKNSALIKFSIPDKTGYSKTNYSIPLTKEGIDIDYCVEKIFEFHKSLTGDECQLMFKEPISQTQYNVGYSIKSQISDPYYNNYINKPRVIIAVVSIQ